jgi:hypothetical protein
MLRGLASRSDVADSSAQDGGIKSRFTDVPFNWDEEPSKMIVHTTLQVFKPRLCLCPCLSATARRYSLPIDQHQPTK